ncbi:MAG: ThuA domain-containing protein, partial [Planctomycetota bacterium]
FRGYAPMGWKQASIVSLAALAAALPAAAGESAQQKKVVMLPGKGSHGFGCHEHRAGLMLLARLLEENVPGFETTVVAAGWPKDPEVFEGVDAIVIDCDGGRIIRQHLDELDALMRKAVGLAVIHYATVVPKGKAGDAMLRWIGGYFETHWSVNPTWTAHFKALPDHPVTRGVEPFTLRDEWYYHMRFVEGMKGVTPILTAVPPEKTRQRPDGAYSGNPVVRARKGMPEHVAWAYQRPGGGRGFGFTGGHWQWNWAHDDVRTLVLNAIVWIAGAEVPPGGVRTPTPTIAELEANLDHKRPPGVSSKAIQDFIDRFDQ